jgi:hypothetical protein
MKTEKCFCDTVDDRTISTKPRKTKTVQLAAGCFCNPRATRCACDASNAFSVLFMFESLFFKKKKPYSTDTSGRAFQQKQK